MGMVLNIQAYICDNNTVGAGHGVKYIDAVSLSLVGSRRVRGA